MGNVVAFGIFFHLLLFQNARTIPPSITSIPGTTAPQISKRPSISLSMLDTTAPSGTGATQEITLAPIMEKLDEMSLKIESIGQSFTRTEASMNEFETKLNDLTNNMENRFTGLEAKMDGLSDGTCTDEKKGSLTLVETAKAALHPLKLPGLRWDR